MSHTETRIARGLREMRVSLTLALPLVAGQLSSMLMTVVDSLLAGRHGLQTLAAVTVGAAMWSVAFLVCIGVMMAVPPSVSQLNGAGRRGEIAAVWQQAVWLAAIIGVVLMAFVWLAPILLGTFGVTPEVIPQATEFLHAIALGAPALSLYFSFRYLSEGLSWTVPTMLFGFGGLVLLVPVGYVLMFGVGPFPELGAAGLGYATSLVLWLQAIGFLV